MFKYYNIRTGICLATREHTPRKKTGLDTVVKELRTISREIASLRGDVITQSNRAQANIIRQVDVPPNVIIKAAKGALAKTNLWNVAYKVLTAYYGLPVVMSYVDETKIPEKAIACYYPPSGPIYGKRGGMTTWVAMHEFAHHLAYHKMPLGGEAEQAFCDAFASEVETTWLALGPTKMPPSLGLI